MIIKKIFSSTLYFLLFLYLIIFIPVLWGYKPLVIISGSMEPILKVGGILYYKEIDKNDYKINDIVVFKSTKYLISHRIVEITNDGFITKGDANTSKDDPITKNDIVGKVVFIIANVAVWVDVLKTPDERYIFSSCGTKDPSNSPYG